MKLRYIFASLAAAALALVSCAEEEEIISSIDGLEVSNSYIGLAADENSSATITIQSAEAWSVDASSVPDWLTVSPMSGTAGQSVKVTLTASANSTATRKAEVKVKVGNRTQFLKITQDKAEAVEVLPSTCADVLAGEDGQTFRVRGTVTKILNTHFGNWYLDDGTADKAIYVYGTLDKKGNANDKTNTYDNLNDASYANSWELAVGDVITVEGPRTTYNGTVELVNVTVISIERSLISVEPQEVAIETPEAGTFTVSVASKVSGVTPIISASWLRVTDVSEGEDGNLVYTFAYDANESTASRTAEIQIKAPEALTAVTVSQVGEEPKGAQNVAGICEQIISTDSKNPSAYKADFREATDVVVSYVNGSNVFIEDKTGAILLYMVDSGLKAGDKLTGILSGTGYLYNGLPEITSIGTEYTATAGGTIPETKVSVETLLANFDKYISRRIKIEGATVTTGIAKGARDGEIEQLGSKIALRAQINGVTIPAGSVGDFIVFPSVYNGQQRVGIYEESQFTPGEGAQAASTIASIVSQIPETATGNDTAVEYEATLTGAVVSYVNGNNAYLEDASGAILLYLKDHGLNPGDVISGKVSGKGYHFNGLPEIVALGTAFTKTTGGTIPETEMTIAALLADYDANFSRRILLKGVTVTDALADGDRSGKVSQNGSELTVYAQLNNKGLTLEKDASGDLICFPTTYKGSPQVSFWDNSHFTAGGGSSQSSVVFLDNCDALHDWAANKIEQDTEEKTQGTGSLKISFNGGGVIVCQKHFSPAVDAKTTKEKGHFAFDLYISDVSSAEWDQGNSEIEIASGGDCDKNELHWVFTKSALNLKAGWNHFDFALSSGIETGGAIDLSNVNWLRIYHTALSSNLTFRIDNIRIYQ